MAINQDKDKDKINVMPAVVIITSADITSINL